MSIIYPQTTQYLDVTIIHPEHPVYNGVAIAISSISDKGPFDILPYHANFICMIKENVTIHRTDKEQEKIPLEKGILKVFENHITIFLGIETLQQEIEVK